MSPVGRSKLPNVDLHSHTRASDGTLTPSELVRRAHARGVDVLAVTDHDTVAGLTEARSAAQALGVMLVSGVEISVTWAGETVHVLGLGVNPDDPVLRAGLQGVRDGRIARARQMAASLERAGISGVWEGAMRHCGDPALVSRTHFARHLVESRVCRDMDEVFARYLVAGRPGFVAQRWAGLAEALGWIRAAGGQAVIAHPGRCDLDAVALEALVGAFRDLGGVGLEVVCGSHDPTEFGRFAAMARRMGLRASRGSDFHSPGEGRYDLGSMPSLPDSVVPIWRDWDVLGRGVMGEPRAA